MRLWTLLLLTATVASAQTVPQRADPTGTVIGHVFCADTNEPARFAHVYLEPVPQPKTLESKDPVVPDQPTAKASTAQLTETVMTTLDGSYSVRNVRPGSYYVIVDAKGYINARNLFTAKQLADPTPEVRDQLAQKLVRVTVEANQTETADVQLQRGGAISGTVLYDDGSPASEVPVKLLHKDADGKWVALPPSAFYRPQTTTTDDRGYFRIASLLPDEYLVDAELELDDTKTTSTPGPNGEQMQFQMSTTRFSLQFYGNGTPHIDDATGIKLRDGEERTGQSMLLPVAKLHRLTGKVLAGRDGHQVNAGKVALVDRESKKELVSTDIAREDGLFHFEFVPDGDYTLRVSDARDVVWEPAPARPNAPMDPFPPPDKERVLATYGGVDQPLLLRGNMLGMIVTVPPPSQP